MLKHYIERKKDEGISKDMENDLGVEPVKVGDGIRKTEEEYCVKDSDAKVAGSTKFLKQTRKQFLIFHGSRKRMHF